MIFHYHLEFKDEPSIQSHKQDGVRGVVSVGEKKQLHEVDYFKHVSAWIMASGIEVRYLSPMDFSKEDHDLSWAMEIKDVVTLFWDKEREEIHYQKQVGYSAKRLQFWVYHTFFPMVLELRGSYHILHAASVEIEGKPVLFTAPSFGGKSTMTDYFIRQGHIMLSDDTLGIKKIDDIYHTISSYPFHRPYRKAEDLGYRVENFSTTSKPVHAVYLLRKSEQNSKINIRKIEGVEKFKVLHHSSFIMLKFMKQERFTFFTQIAKQVPLFEVNYPHDMTKLPEVYEVIVSHSTVE